MEIAIGMAVSSVIAANLSYVLRARVSRAIATVKRITGSGPPDKPVVRARPEEMSLNSYVLLQVYVLMAVTGLGYLALTWSTVVLLGGFVTSLGKMDFWCLTAISMLQAARIFNDSGDNLFPIFLNLTGKLASKVFANPVEGFIRKLYQHPTGHGLFTVLWVQVVLVIVQILSIPVLVIVLYVGGLYAYGPVACIGLSVWRLQQHDYVNTAGDDGKANLVPALNIFYCLVIAQGVLFFLWWLINWAAILVVVSLREECQLPEKWGSLAVIDYLYDTRAKCWRDPTSIDGRNLINYAVDLMDSESQKDYLSGARMLDTFIKLKADVRSLLLPSRPKMQRLIDTLGWRTSKRELREVVSRIVAYLAGDIHLSQFPGAIQCISSLLDTALPYWSNQQGLSGHSTKSKSKEDSADKETLIYIVKGIEEYRAKKAITQGDDAQQDEVDSSTHGRKGDDWNELILQGLTILERLAFDQQNISDIYSTPGLLLKIMAPLHSETLIQDVSIRAWADVVNGSLKVVHRLLRVPEWIGRKEHYEICSSQPAVKNLQKILDAGHQNFEELQMRAMDILTELALDVETNLTSETKKNLIKKQLQIFLTDDKQEGHATKLITKRLKVTAGETLALLSKTATMSALVTAEEYEGIVKILEAKNKIIYRTIAAEILENLCSHHKMDKEDVKNILLPQVLTEALTSQREPVTGASQTDVPVLTDDARNQAVSAPRNDEEKQLSEHRGQIKSLDQVNKEHTAMMELQEAFLSLTLVICEKLIISADDFDEVVQKIATGESEFVAKLKIIVEENCEATANSLRIVKLCGQIAFTMMRRSQYMTHFKDQKFVEILTEASRIMCNLESCMLFAGTDGGAKKAVRPLLSDLVKEAQAMVA